MERQILDRQGKELSFLSCAIGGREDIKEKQDRNEQSK